MGEAAKGDQLQIAKDGARKNYKDAQLICKADLGSCNAVRLGLALNLSVFYYEVDNNHREAITVGDEAMSEALKKIDDCDEESFRDAKGIIDMLRENL